MRATIHRELDNRTPKYNEFKCPHLFRMHDSRIPVVGPTTHHHYEKMANMNKEIIKITLSLIMVGHLNYIHGHC